MSVIFVHAPEIVPSVLGRPLPFHRALHRLLALLHASLLLRLAGETGPAARVRGSEAAVLLFLATVSVLVARTPRAAHHRGQASPPPISLAARQQLIGIDGPGLVVGRG